MPGLSEKVSVFENQVYVFENQVSVFFKPDILDGTFRIKIFYPELFMNVPTYRLTPSK